MKKAIYAMLCVAAVVCVFSVILIAVMKLIIGAVMFFAGCSAVFI